MLRAQVTDIVRSIADTVLGFDLEPCGAVRPGRLMTAEVRVTGAWSGVIGVEAAPMIARRSAEAMFGLEREPEAEELRDALGELVNMIGGNLKAVLPGPSQLSLPKVVTNNPTGWDMPHLERVSFRAGDQILTVVVVKEDGLDAATTEQVTR